MSYYLSEYINNSLKAGVEGSTLKASLLKAGWQKDQIDQALKVKVRNQPNGSVIIFRFIISLILIFLLGIIFAFPLGFITYADHPLKDLRIIIGTTVVLLIGLTPLTTYLNKWVNHLIKVQIVLIFLGLFFIVVSLFIGPAEKIKNPSALFVENDVLYIIDPEIRDSDYSLIPKREAIQWSYQLPEGKFLSAEPTTSSGIDTKFRNYKNLEETGNVQYSFSKKIPFDGEAVNFWKDGRYIYALVVNEEDKITIMYKVDEKTERFTALDSYSGTEKTIGRMDNNEIVILSPSTLAVFDTATDEFDFILSVQGDYRDFYNYDQKQLFIFGSAGVIMIDKQQGVFSKKFTGKSDAENLL